MDCIGRKKDGVQDICKQIGCDWNIWAKKLQKNWKILAKLGKLGGSNFAVLNNFNNRGMQVVFSYKKYWLFDGYNPDHSTFEKCVWITQQNKTNSSRLYCRPTGKPMVNASNVSASFSTACVLLLVEIFDGDFDWSNTAHRFIGIWVSLWQNIRAQSLFWLYNPVQNLNSYQEEIIVKGKEKNWNLSIGSFMAKLQPVVMARREIHHSMTSKFGT